MTEPAVDVERRVWKFRLPDGITGINDVIMPEAAKCVLFDIQDGVFHAWFEVNPSSPTIERRLHIVGTGQTIPRGATHLASFQVELEDNFVWHLYEARA